MSDATLFTQVLLDENDADASSENDSPLFGQAGSDGGVEMATVSTSSVSRRGSRNRQQSDIHVEEGTPMPRRARMKDIFLRFVVARFKHDWCFLVVLGVCMALISFFLDIAIESVLHFELLLNNKIMESGLPGIFRPFFSYIAWLILPLICISAATITTSRLAPSAAGSGIPQIKTLLRGFEAEEYLCLKTLGVKVFGLIFVLGSRLPVGKEGPFIHIACCLAMNLSRYVFKRSDYLSEEVLSAACAVGIACNFAAPIGGVLFAIEVTTNYFAVRNYWRSFFAAISGTLLIHLLNFRWKEDRESLTALFKTNFPLDFPFHPKELVLFVIMGLICGVTSIIFIRLVKTFMKRIDSNKPLHGKFLSKLERLFKMDPHLYAIGLAAIYNTLTFPQGFGRLFAGKLSVHQGIDLLFDNETWATLGYVDVGEELGRTSNEYMHPYFNVYFSLVLFILVNFLFTTISMTISAPCGVFMPVFLIGAAFGRLVGEAVAAWFPLGLTSNGSHIVPGGYAVVGAAALAGGVTRTISSAIIVFELTGQIGHIIPVMVAVLISNGVSSSFEYSIYDTIIYLKKLPFLPDVDSRKMRKIEAKVYVKDFMQDLDGKVLEMGWTLGKVISQLFRNRGIEKWSVVDENGMFMGVVQRFDIEQEIKIMEAKYSNIHALPTSPTTVTASVPGFVPANQVPFEFEKITINAAAPTVTPYHNLHEVHRLFSVLRYQRCYVTSRGKLVGIITLRSLQDAMQSQAKKIRRMMRQQKYTELRAQSACSSVVSSDEELQGPRANSPMKN